MMRTASHFLFPIAIAALCTLATTAASPDTRWDRFAGDWRAESDGTQVVKTAIEQATQEMSVLTRRMARGRLREHNAPPASIRMSRQGDMFTIHFAGSEPVPLPISGAPVKVGDRTIHIQPETDGDGLRHVGCGQSGAAGVEGDGTGVDGSGTI